jgi:5-(hydroxymethyl)furfural/furfural oxidase
MPLARSARQARSLRTYGLACARLSSGPDQPADLLLQFIADTSPNAHGDRLGILGTALYAPRSRGTVTISAPSADVPPGVAFNLLADPGDASRLASGILVALRLLDDPEVRAIRGPVIAVTPGSLVRRLNRPDRSSRLMAAALAAVLDAPRPLRDLALRRAGLVVGAKTVADADIGTLLDYVSAIFHPAGTCAMGHADDPAAVVDPACRVRNVAGLAVVDASVMPVLPAANTCIPTMMIAEHAALMLVPWR